MTDALHVNDMPSNWDDMEDAHTAFGELDVRDRIAVALLDENGLRPTQSALDALVAIVEMVDDVDELWSDDARPGSPDFSVYAAYIENGLKHLRRTR